VRVGVSLPQFRHDAERAIEVARRAEAVGLDGAFVFDHLWPLGRPDRPALHSTTLLGALVAETSRITLGTLVARVGLVADAVLVHTLVTLHRMAGDGRFIAGVGAGDRANRDENRAYGIPFPPAAERVAAVIACARRLREAGVQTWVGGLSPAVRQAAVEADGWNGWGVSPAQFARQVARLRVQPGARPELEATWGGRVLVGRTPEEARTKQDRYRGDRRGVVRGTVQTLARHLEELAAAGASWAVCAPIDVGADPQAVDLVADARRQAFGG
jgi:alkanesulfonate monooxygenase SsuD/methylene tetrahydromethanopterin reductase-like flavin-dependent oxidoreductase (luciferase family)